MLNRKELIAAISAEATEWRRELHRHPQTMYQEEFASAFISKKLTEWGIPHERGIAGTGVVASIEGRRNLSGRAVAFRADMDALDITEASGQPWSSETPGKMHGCGHDGHTATLLALARYLNETRNFDGIIRLLFQPAEEGGRGAFRMLDEGLLERFPFDEVYGYHNWPTLPRGMFATTPGPMLAAADNFEITLKGKGGHAAMPHHTHDVVPAAAQLILALQTLVSRETDPMAAAVLSITTVDIGSGAHNVIPNTAYMNGTVRTFNQKVRDHIEARFEGVVQGIATTYGVTGEYTYNRLMDPVVNHDDATTFCRSAAGALVGDSNVVNMPPLMGGEDFGGFLQQRPGAFMMIGQGEKDASSAHSAGLHTPYYDFNDAIIPLAAGYFAELAERRLPVD
jgi:hippurate hydrolase